MRSRFFIILAVAAAGCATEQPRVRSAWYLTPDAKMRISLLNHGERSISIRDVKVNPNKLTIDAREFPLPVGEIVVLDVNLDVKGPKDRCIVPVALSLRVAAAEPAAWYDMRKWFDIDRDLPHVDLAGLPSNLNGRFAECLPPPKP